MHACRQVAAGICITGQQGVGRFFWGVYRVVAGCGAVFFWVYRVVAGSRRASRARDAGRGLQRGGGTGAGWPAE